MYVLDWRTVSAPMRGLFWCLFPELRCKKGNKYHNNTGVSPEIVCHESTYIILFLTRQNGSINDNNKNTIFTHRLRVSLDRFSSCWWRHNRLVMTSQLLDNCDAITRIVRFISLDIDFIHSDIHGRSCKKYIIMYSYGELHVFMRSREGYFGVYFPSCPALLDYIYKSMDVVIDNMYKFQIANQNPFQIDRLWYMCLLNNTLS